MTSILGTNKIGGSNIIDKSSRGTNYFAKVVHCITQCFTLIYFPAQGHLSPDAGFIYNVEQDATYYFLNVAPQFQSFNNGNWKILEMTTRDVAAR